MVFFQNGSPFNCADSQTRAALLLLHPTTFRERLLPFPSFPPPPRTQTGRWHTPHLYQAQRCPRRGFLFAHFHFKLPRTASRRISWAHYTGVAKIPPESQKGRGSPLLLFTCPVKGALPPPPCVTRKRRGEEKRPSALSRRTAHAPRSHALFSCFKAPSCLLIRRLFRPPRSPRHLLHWPIRRRRVKLMSPVLSSLFLRLDLYSKGRGREI